MDTTITYEESETGSGKNECVFVHGSWTYCPSHELMEEQIEHDGIKRGSRVRHDELGTGTVLSCYRKGQVRVCVRFDDRKEFFDRQGLTVEEVVAIKKKSFIDAAIENTIVDPEKDIDVWIAEWHAGDSLENLHEWLGMTMSEYASFVKDPKTIHEIVESRQKTS